MSDHHEIARTTFTLERVYPAAPEAVFAAWADPRTKARWFAGDDADLELDLRVGGREVVRGRPEGGRDLTFTSTFHDVVEAERIVFSSTLHAEGLGVTTLSITSVELEPAVVDRGAGTRLVLTQQGTFLDGHEEPAWREQGTASQLDALGTVLT